MKQVEFMRKLRKEKNLTQEEMADIINLSVNGYAKIERGECVPSSRNLRKIAHVLGVSMDVLVNKNHAKEEINHPKTTSFCTATVINKEIELLQVKVDNLELAIQAKNREIEYLKEIITQKSKEVDNLQEIIQLLKFHSQLKTI